MANTYTQIHIHVVFAVKNRMAMIDPQWKDDLYKYITGIVQKCQHKLIAINGMPDHIHILFGMRPIQSLSDLVQDIKANSSRWINEQKFTARRFEWQGGFGAFSYNKNQLPRVINYIHNQEQHHLGTNFVDEYKGIMKEFDVDFDERYIFKPLADGSFVR